MKRQAGFTLIELLLALAIFSIIGITTVKQILQIQNTKTAAFEDLDGYSDLRSAVQILTNDLQQAFHILYDDLGADIKKSLQTTQAVPHTLFDGRARELIFTALSHRVYYAEKRESEQTEISYFLEKREGHQYPSMMKRESELIDSDLYQGGVIYNILDNVISLEFQFWDDKLSRWITDWNSDGGSTRDRFPKAVKMKLEVVGRNNAKVKLETSFKVGFPNNEAFVVQF